MTDLKGGFQQLSSFALHGYSSFLCFAYLTSLPGAGDPGPRGWVGEREEKPLIIRRLSALSLGNESNSS